MDSINLASYRIYFKGNQEDSKYLDWDDLFNFNPQTTLIENKKSALEILKSNIVVDIPFSNNSSQKSLMFEFFEQKDNMLFGRAYYGRYGERGIALNVRDGEYMDVPANTSFMNHFYFLFYFPSFNKKFCILILERKGSRGMKSIFEEYLNKKIFNSYSNYFKFEIFDLVPKKLVNMYIDKGEILSFEFNEIKSHTDSANILNEELNDIRGKISVSFKIDEGYKEEAKRILKKFISGNIKENISNDNFLEFSSVNKENFKTTIKLNGKPKVFSFGGDNIFKPYLDVTNDIINIEDGIPNFDELNQIAINHAKYLVKEVDDSNG